MTSGLFLQILNLFMLFWGRTLGFFLTAVPFSARTIPTQVKIWLSALLAFLIFMVNYQTPVQISGDTFGYLIQFTGELAIGCVFGFVTQIIFAAFQLAGQYLDMQIGFGMANMIDPQNGTQIPLFGNFQYIMATLVFFIINGHYVLLTGLVQSYNLLPLGGGVHFSGSFFSFIFSLLGEMFVISIKIALPVLAALFITDVILGVIGRTVPQLNVFIVSLPLKIGLGVGLMMIIMPVLVWAFEAQFGVLYQHLSTVLRLLKG